MKLRFTLQQLSLSKWYYTIIIGLPILFPILLLQEEVTDPTLMQAAGFAEIILTFLTLFLFSLLLWVFFYAWKIYPFKYISLTALLPPHFIIPKAVLSAFFVFALYFFAKYSLLLFQQEGLEWWDYLVAWLVMWGLLIEAYLYLNGLSALILNKPKGFSWIKHVGVLVLFLVILPMTSTTVVLVVWSKFL